MLKEVVEDLLALVDRLAQFFFERTEAEFVVRVLRAFVTFAAVVIHFGLGFFVLVLVIVTVSVIVILVVIVLVLEIFFFEANCFTKAISVIIFVFLGINVILELVKLLIEFHSFELVVTIEQHLVI